MDKADRTAAAADCLQQPRDKVAVNGICVAAGTILQHAETIDDDIGLVLPDQPRQRCCVHRHHGEFQIGGAHLLRRRKMPRDPDRLKTSLTQIVGDEPADQAGRAQHENLPRTDIHVLPYNGFAIISHTMVMTEPKPGMPNNIQRRISAK